MKTDTSGVQCVGRGPTANSVLPPSCLQDVLGKVKALKTFAMEELR